MPVEGEESPAARKCAFGIALHVVYLVVLVAGSWIQSGRKDGGNYES
jgi:hypothetical protein